MGRREERGGRKQLKAVVRESVDALPWRRLLALPVAGEAVKEVEFDAKKE
jgi:hypothetical protein